MHHNKTVLVCKLSVNCVTMDTATSIDVHIDNDLDISKKVILGNRNGKCDMIMSHVCMCVCVCI